MKFKKLTLAALLAALPLHATAMDSAPALAGFNFGGGAGANSLDSEDYTGNGNNIVDDNQIAYKALFGYRLGPVVSLESQYIAFGTAKNGDDRVKAHGVTAGGVFEAPLTPFLHPYAKAGALFWDADGEFSGVRRSDTGTDFTYGAGLRFVLARSFDIRTEYERFEFQESNVNMVSAMLQFNF